MKLLIYLEKSKAFWSLVCITTLFFILRLPSLFEPYWYGDEGIYQVIGMGINNGRLLYQEIWDNKPPLLYVTYALLHGDQFLARCVSLLVGFLSVILFFLLAQLVYKKLKASIIATSLFAVLFGTPYLEGNIANAENFILLPIIAGALLIYALVTKHHLVTNRPQHLLLISIGLLLGIAFLFKIVALFDFVAFFLFWTIYTLPQRANLFSKKVFLTIIRQGTPLVAGFLTPFLITCLYFLVNNALPDFLQSAFAGNIGYVGWKNNFIIPQGLLILKIIILAIILLTLFIKRTQVSLPAVFIFLWLAFEIFSTFFSQRPYTHYVLMMLPSFCLLFGFIFAAKTVSRKALTAAITLAVIYLVTQNFNLYSIKKTTAYYANAFQFLTAHKDVRDYQAFFDGKTPRDYSIVSYIKTHASQSDTIFLWGDSAQIYAMAGKIPPSKYTVAYHIKQTQETIDETEHALKISKPRYIIALDESGPIPFSLPEYQIKYNVSGGTIYERTY